MDPFRRVKAIARHERSRKTVKVGQELFNTVRNLAAVGAAAASIVTGGFFVTRDRVPDAPPQTPAPLTLLQQLRGPVAFDVLFTQDLGTPPPLASGARPSAEVKARADGVDFIGPGGNAPLVLRHGVPAKFVADLSLAVQAGTEGTFTATLRSAGPQGYQVQIDMANELIRFQHYDNSVAPQRITSLISNAIPAAGLQRGQTLDLSLAVDGGRYRIFVGGALVADVTDLRVSVPDATTTNLSMGASVIRGVFSLSKLKVYALAESSATQSLLTQLRGQVVYAPVFPKDLGTPPPGPSARPTAKVQARADVVDILPAGQYAPILTNRLIPARHLAEFELSSQPTTDGLFSWTLRGAGQRSIQVSLDPVNELVRFYFADSGVSPNQTLTLIPSAVSVAGIQKGRVLRLAAAIDGSRYRLFVDGELVADVIDDRVAPPTSAQTTINLGGTLTKGGYTLGKLKVYELRDLAPSPAPRP